MHNLIGITGRMGAGKTTAAELLVEARGALRVSFARQVRIDIAQMLDHVYGMTNDLGIDYWDEDAMITWVNERKPQLRTLMQGLGQGVRDVVDEEYWIRALDDHIDDLEYEHDPRLFVIDDLRYANEAAWVRHNGGLLIRVVTPTWLRQARLNMGAAEFELADNHPSECGEADITVDYTVDGSTRDSLESGILLAQAVHA